MVRAHLVVFTSNTKTKHNLHLSSLSCHATGPCSVPTNSPLLSPLASPHLTAPLLICPLLPSPLTFPLSGTWSLFCPNEAKGLPDVWGPEFEALYEKYEAEGKARRVMPAQELWSAILSAQVETGKLTVVITHISHNLRTLILTLTLSFLSLLSLCVG